MSSDRGTLQRGSAAEQQPPWPQPTAPASRRPPSAPRERKPVLAVLALILIVGGALTAGYLVTQNNKKVAAIEISQQLGAGQRIPLSALQEVQISANSGVNYVPWDEASQVAQFYASAAIPPGTLLNGAMVVRGTAATRGKDQLGLALKEGQLPDGLQVGDHIDIYEVSNAQTSCPGRPGDILDSNAVVLAIRLPSANSGSSDSAFVQIAATPAAAGAIACSASTGIAGIAIIPAGGQSAAAGAPGSPAGSTVLPGPGSTTSARPRATRPSKTPPAGGASTGSASPSPGTRAG
jgi:hypothetical protein